MNGSARFNLSERVRAGAANKRRTEVFDVQIDFIYHVVHSDVVASASAKHCRC